MKKSSCLINNIIRENRWKCIYKEQAPIIATAIHKGHYIDNEIIEQMIIPEEDRLREEDPYTELFASICENKIIIQLSRFMVDMNRPQHRAVYLNPGESWGISVWKKPLTNKSIRYLDKLYLQFYNDIRKYLDIFKNEFNHFVILDIHSYNHQRSGPEEMPDDPKVNPDINVGTGTMQTKKWRILIDQFIHNLGGQHINGRRLDVRENVKFQGGYFPKWIHNNYMENACVLSIEIKKIFMNEWTGEVNYEKVDAVKEALRSTIPGIYDELSKLTE